MVLRAVTVASIAVVVSLITSVVVASRAYVQRGEQPHRLSRSLEVTGSAKRLLVSDLGLWSIGVSGEGKTLEEAYQKLAASTSGVRAFLDRRGFGPESVSVGAIRTTEHFRLDKDGKPTRERLGYELDRAFAVRHGDVNRVSKAAGEVTELIQSGALVRSGAPQFLYTKLAALKLQMIGDATADARRRAELVAAGSKCRLGAVKEAKAGVFQITPPYSTEVSSGGVNDTSTIEKDITAVVHLSLVVEPE